MNKSLVNTLFRSLACVSLVGLSFSTGELTGQQLTPLTGQSTAPAAKSVTPVGQPLLPMPQPDVAPVTKTQSQPALPPIVQAPVVAAKPTALPPIVTAAKTNQESVRQPVAATATPQGNAIASQMVATAGQAPRVAAAPAADTNQTVKGKNFPVNAQQQIQQFLRENGASTTQYEAPSLPYSAPRVQNVMPTAQQVAPTNPQIGVPGMASGGLNIQQTGYAPQQYVPSGPRISPGFAQRRGFRQQGSPSDLPVETVPAPGYSPQIINPPVMNAPSVPGQILNSDAFSVPQPELRQQAGVAQGGVAVGGDTYFGQPHIYDSAGDYDGGTYSPADIEYGSIDDTFACCGFVSGASEYFIFDSLVWQRGDGDFRAGNFTALDSFSWQGGARMTFGKRRDCARGWEIGFSGFDPWISLTREFNPPASLFGAVFGSVGGFPESTFSAFRNATFLEQFQKTDLYSLEYNQTWWGSDVAKAYIGTRFVYFDDEFRLSSQNILGQVGIHSINTTNNMFGIHFGSEVLYDIGYRLSFSLGGKLGVYANFWEGRKTLLNNNTIWINATRRSTDWGATAELGAFGRYKIGPNARFRFGYEIMVLSNVYDTESNYNPTVLPTAGQFYNEDGAFFHGATFGFEIYR